jgi:hypothetical protein
MAFQNCASYLRVIVFFSLALVLSHTAAFAQTFSRTDYPSLGNNHIAVDVNGDAILDLVGTGVNSAAVM